MQAAAGATTLTTASTAASADRTETEQKPEWEWVDPPPLYKECVTHRGPLVDRELLGVIVETMDDYYAGFSRPFDPEDVIGVSIQVREPIRLYVKTDRGVETVHPIGPMSSDVEKIGMWFDGGAGDIIDILADRFDMPTDLVQASRIHEGAPLEVSVAVPFRRQSDV